MQREEKQRRNILKNVKVLSKLYGLNSDIMIVIHEDIVVYGIMNKGKTFYSKQNHIRVSTICLYHRSLTVGFLSDLSREIASIVTK